MKKLLISLCLVLCIATTAWAGAIFDGGGIIASEVDGSPLAFVYKVILPNGTLSITSGVATYTAAGGVVATDTIWAAAGDIVQGTGNDTAAVLTAGTLGAYLRSGGPAAANVWSTLILPNAGTAFKLPVFSATNTMTELAAVGATGELLVGNTGAIPSWLAKGTVGQVLNMNAAATAAEWEHQKEVIVSLSAGKTLAKAEFCGTTVILTGTGTYLYPTITSDMVGCKARFKVRGAYTASLDFPATVVPWLAGTALTAANKVTSSGLTGDGIDVVITTTTAVEADNANGVWIDGGA